MKSFMFRRSFIFVLFCLVCIFGCRQAFEVVRGKSFKTTNTSKTNVLKGTVSLSEIDPNFVRLRMADIEDNNYPDSVRLHVLLTDDRGNFILGMAPPYDHLNDWKQYWNELYEKYGEETIVKRNIAEYSVHEVGYKNRTPMAFSLVFDYSAEMKGKTIELEFAAETMALIKRDTDAVSIVKYDDLAVTEVQLTQDHKEILEKNKRDGLARFGGKRATYAACLEGMKKLEGFSGDKFLFLVTNGQDNASKTTVQEVIQTARNENIKLFVIATEKADTMALKQMGIFGKGKFVYLATTSGIDEIFEDIYRSLVNFYVVTYKPPIYFGEHHVRVQALMPDASIEAYTYAKYNREQFDPYAPADKPMPLMIQFEFNRADIKQESSKTLQFVIDALKGNPLLMLEIRGHTDLVGKEDYNKRLSEERANAVKSYLIKDGIDEKRLTVAGYGSSRPVAPNDKEENRQLNRRTEFVITGR